MKTVGIIPARLQSARLPRKLLLSATGRPLIQYAWEAACQCEELDEVIVATDSDEIADVVRSFGARVEMTRTHHSGTDRIAEVVQRCCASAELVINIQGDEPELDPAIIRSLIHQIERSDAQMATVAAPLTDAAKVLDPSCVKVVTDASGRALYFSRAPIPFSRDASVEDCLSDGNVSPWLQHVGLYAYRRDFLLHLTSLPPSPLEQLEKLEQLRALQAGAAISVAVVNHPTVGIDTPGDYAAFIERQASRNLRRAA